MTDEPTPRPAGEPTPDSPTPTPDTPTAAQAPAGAATADGPTAVHPAAPPADTPPPGPWLATPGAPPQGWYPPAPAPTGGRFWQRPGVRRGAGVAALGAVVGAVITGGAVALAANDDGRDGRQAFRGPGGYGFPGGFPGGGLPGQNVQDGQNGQNGQARPNGGSGGERGLPNGVPGALPGGGVPGGGQAVLGTLTAVSGSSITVRTATGTSTYAVTSSTPVIRDGQQASVSALKVGDPVVVQVTGATSGSGGTVERILAGTLPAGGPGGRGNR